MDKQYFDFSEALAFMYAGVTVGNDEFGIILCYNNDILGKSEGEADFEIWDEIWTDEILSKLWYIYE